MTDVNLVEVTLLFTAADLERIQEGADYDPNSPPAHEMEDLDWEWTVDLNLEPLGDNRFRVPEPVSVSFVGPHGPMLNLGEVIEALPHSDGVLRYRRTLESPPVWSRLIGGVESLGALEEERAAHVLRQIEQAGCRWELCVGNLTIQGSAVTSEDPSLEVSAIIRELVKLLKGRGPGIQ